NCDAGAALQTLQDWPWDLTDWTVRNSHRQDARVKSGVGPRRGQREGDRVLPASERRLARLEGKPWAPGGGGEGRTGHPTAAWELAYWIGVYHGYVPKGE